jgi:hypothetical protein
MQRGVTCGVWVDVRPHRIPLFRREEGKETTLGTAARGQMHNEAWHPVKMISAGQMIIDRRPSGHRPALHAATWQHTGLYLPESVSTGYQLLGEV